MNKGISPVKYAEAIASSIYARHYSNKSWQPLRDDMMGLLTQIDNMTAGMSETIDRHDETVMLLRAKAHDIEDIYKIRLRAAYKCIIDATKAFAPPTNGKDVSDWFDKHQATIDAVLEWKNKQ